MTVEPVVITGSRLKSLLFLGVSLAFVAIGVAILQKPSSDRVMAWGAILFFGLGVVVFAWTLVRPQTLTLDGDGFTVGGGLTRHPKQVLWRDVQGFYLFQLPRGGKVIGFNFEPDARPNSLLLRINRQLGVEGALPKGWPGSLQQMADELNAYRMRALGLTG